LKPNSLDLNHLQEIDMKKVEALKKAVSEGTYAVPAEDLVPKLIESVFRNTILDETPIGASVSQFEAEDHYDPQHSDAREIPGAAMVNRKGSPSVSTPSDGSPSGSGPKRGPRRTGTGFGPTAASGDDLEVR
jgi:hypothetical protein